MKFKQYFESLQANIKYDKLQGKLIGVLPNHAIRLTKLGKMYRGEELDELVPERKSHTFALHPLKWESTFHSLTLKDYHKIGRYGPINILIKPGTLIAEMRYATAFMYGQREYLDKYKKSLRLLDAANIGDYEAPELLIPN